VHPVIPVDLGTVCPIVSSSDYLREEKKVHTETNLYLISHLNGILVCMGVIDTLRPKNIHKAIKGPVTPNHQANAERWRSPITAAASDTIDSKH
jgi:hypothetical protein